MRFTARAVRFKPCEGACDVAGSGCGAEAPVAGVDPSVTMFDISLNLPALTENQPVNELVPFMR